MDACTNTRFHKIPRPPGTFPSGSEKMIRVEWVYHHFDTAGITIGIQRFCPIVTAVGSFVNPSFFVRGVKVPQYGYPNGVGVLRVNDDASDVVAFAQTQVEPTFAAVFTFKHTETSVGRTAGVNFPGT